MGCREALKSAGPLHMLHLLQCWPGTFRDIIMMWWSCDRARRRHAEKNGKQSEDDRAADHTLTKKENIPESAVSVWPRVWEWLDVVTIRDWQGTWWVNGVSATHDARHITATQTSTCLARRRFGTRALLLLLSLFTATATWVGYMIQLKTETIKTMIFRGSTLTF